MKNIALFSFCTILVLSVFTSYAYGAPAQDAGVTFRDVEGKEWILSEFKNSGKTISIDRKKLEADGMGGFFTISFQEGRASGMGAPNRYFGPYTAGANRTLSTGNLASTMMAAFKEPDELKESEYFAYLSKVTRWDLRKGNLELYCSGSNGGEVILIFTRR